MGNGLRQLPRWRHLRIAYVMHTALLFEDSGDKARSENLYLRRATHQRRLP